MLSKTREPKNMRRSSPERQFGSSGRDDADREALVQEMTGVSDRILAGKAQDSVGEGTQTETNKHLEPTENAGLTGADAWSC